MKWLMNAELHKIYTDGHLGIIRNADGRFNYLEKNVRDSILKPTAYGVNHPVVQHIFDSLHVDLSMSHIIPFTQIKPRSKVPLVNWVG